MTENFINDYTVTVGGAGIDDSATSLTVSAAASITAGFRILIGTETMLVTAGGTTITWTVTRGIEETTKASHNNGDKIDVILTAGGLQQILLQRTLSNVVVQAGTANDTSIAATINVTAGNLLIVTFAYEGGSDGSTISDTLSTSYTQSAVQLNGSRTAVFYGVATDSGANTFTATMAGNSYPRIAFMEVTGGWSTEDAHATASAANASVTSTVYGDFVYAALGGYHSGSIISAYIPLFSATFTNGSDCLATACYIGGTARSHLVSFNNNDAQPAIVVVAFK